LELPISDGRIWWANHPGLEEHLNQLEKYDGTRSNSHRKDDYVDTLGLAQQHFGVKHREELPKEVDEKTKRAREEEFERERRRAMHAAMFAPTNDKPHSTAQAEPQKQPAFVRPFPQGGGNFAQLPRNMRGRPNR
jgi:hypothetical protein